MRKQKIWCAVVWKYETVGTEKEHMDVTHGGEHMGVKERDVERCERRSDSVGLEKWKKKTQKQKLAFIYRHLHLSQPFIQINVKHTQKANCVLTPVGTTLRSGAATLLHELHRTPIVIKDQVPGGAAFTCTHGFLKAPIAGKRCVNRCYIMHGNGLRTVIKL